MSASATGASVRWSLGGRRLALAVWWGLLATLACAEPPRGLPFIRTYPLDEIGNVPRSLRLGFDAFGRVAVMYDGIYFVLNDSAWVDRMDPASVAKVRMTAIKVAEGNYYYGARGSWGLVEQAADGRFRAAPVVPPDAPAWTEVNPFNQILTTSTGLYFYEFNGAVHWDIARQENSFFPLPRLSCVFAVGERVFASCQDQPLQELLPGTDEIRPLDDAGLGGQFVTFAAPLDAAHALLALEDGRLLIFDGHQAVPWPAQARHQLQGKITALVRLVEGGVAVALAGKGIFLFSDDDSLRWSLTVPEFQRVGNMAAGEPGVLWVAGENAVHKIYYHSSLTSFGQKHGISVSWPQVANWRDRTVIASSKQLYVTEPARPGEPPGFVARPLAPPVPVDTIAASGPHLLAGSAAGVFAVELDGTTTPLMKLENVAGLKFIDPDTCLVIASREIGALRHAGGRWTECAPRIPGIGDAPIRLEKHGAVWIEMGGDQVARLDLVDGRLDLQRIELPWDREQWTNVGSIGSIIVLSGTSGQRAYYDDVRRTLCEAPAIDQLLNRSPYWLLRMMEDAGGVIWATHIQGIVTFTPQGGDYVVDASTFDLRNDSYPAVTILPDSGIWISASRSLYHVERQATRNARGTQTVLVSLVAGQRDTELLKEVGPPSLPRQFCYDDNSLSFRFFSGTYAWLSPPIYEYRLGPGEPWTPVDPGSLLRFPKLRDGTYQLDVRQALPHLSGTPPFSFAFTINPPWYRTPLSYAGCATVLLLALLGLARWINHRSLRHNSQLQHLVHERTRKLEDAMAQLGEKSRNEATLAERTRLAGEIHDSMQQGLSGSILHLDTTLNHPSVSPEVRGKLNVVRNMLAYTREEVQQAVWNLGSPLLHNATLGNALRTIAGYIGSGTTAIEVTAVTESAALPSATQHHLLRIAQEALTNAVKHAQARRIRVTLENGPGAVILSVTDDGRGFDAAAASKVEGHFGLRGLRTRARAIKADLQILSSSGGGTTVRVTLPITPKPVP